MKLNELSILFVNYIYILKRKEKKRRKEKRGAPTLTLFQAKLEN